MGTEKRGETQLSRQQLLNGASALVLLVSIEMWPSEWNQTNAQFHAIVSAFTEPGYALPNAFDGSACVCEPMLPAGAMLFACASWNITVPSLTPLCQNLCARLVSSGAPRLNKPAKNEPLGSDLPSRPVVFSAPAAASAAPGGVTVRRGWSCSCMVHRVSAQNWRHAKPEKSLWWVEVWCFRHICIFLVDADGTSCLPWELSGWEASTCSTIELKDTNSRNHVRRQRRLLGALLVELDSLLAKPL